MCTWKVRVRKSWFAQGPAKTFHRHRVSITTSTSGYIPVIHRRSALFIAYIQSVITAGITRSHEINSIRLDGGKDRIFTRHLLLPPSPPDTVLQTVIPVRGPVRIRIVLSTLHNSTRTIGKHNNLKRKTKWNLLFTKFDTNWSSAVVRF